MDAEIKGKAKERVRLTQGSVATLRKKAADLGKSDITFWDDDIRGFGLRIRKGGNASWIYQYQRGLSQGKIRIGDASAVTADMARQRAREERGKVDLGGDPSAQKAIERVKDKQTFAGIVDLYLNAKQTEWRPASLREGRRYLLATFQSLHRIPAHKIEKKHVAAIVTRIAPTHPGAAGAALLHVNACLNWAVGIGLIDTNPADGIPNVKHGERDRVLSDDELRRVWLACSDDSDPGRIMRLLILTGQRRDEVSGMAEEELDRKNGTWTLPKERTKNKRTHTLALPDEAWKIIGPPSHIGPLFGRGGGRYTGWQGFKRVLDRRCNIVKPWVIHDIRRSVATGMADIGVQPHIIEAVLNHISGHKSGVAGIYNRSSYDHEKKAALKRWARYVALALDPDLLAAHKAYLDRDDDNAREEAGEVFRDAIAEGGARWDRYLRVIVTGEESGEEAGEESNVMQFPFRAG
jgi:integrase